MWNRPRALAMSAHNYVNVSDVNRLDERFVLLVHFPFEDSSEGRWSLPEIFILRIWPNVRKYEKPEYNWYKQKVNILPAGEIWKHFVKDVYDVMWAKNVKDA